jgi:hypothetical protein
LEGGRGSWGEMMEWWQSVIWWFQSLFCRHDFEPFYNIYGDEIIHRNWKRSAWKCSECGAEQLRDDLVEGLGARPDVQQMIEEYHQKF